MKKGDYWSKPRIEKLKQMSQSELRSVSNFTAGRKGFGEVSFLKPVDLTGIDLGLLLGGIIDFGPQDISIYPSTIDIPKAKPGDGVNQPARVQLEGCYPIDRATKQPVYETNDPRYDKFLRRIKNVGAQKFVDYTSEGGVWAFEVDHFSRYGLPLDSDSEDEQEAEDQAEADESAESESSEDAQSDVDFEPPTRGLHEGSGSEGESETTSGSSSYGNTEVSDNVSEQLDAWAAPTAHKLNEQGWLKMREMQSDFFGDAPLPPRGVINKNEEKEAIQRVKRHLEEKGFEFAEEEEVMLDEQRAVKVSLRLFSTSEVADK